MVRESDPLRQRLETALLRELEAALRHAAAEIEKLPASSRVRPDLVFKRNGESFVVELKVAPVNRLEHSRALLAAATLQARRSAEALGARAVPVLGLERLSDATLAELQRYMEEVAPGQPWGVIDRRGRRHFNSVELRELDAPGRVRPRAERGTQSSFDLFTDLGQWMAKVLLAPRLPEAMLAAPRDRARNARHLALIAEVSAPTAARWVQHMKSEGFIEEHEGGLRLVRRRAFFERWRRALARPRKEIVTRFVLPSGSVNEQLNLVAARYAREAVAPFDPEHAVPYPKALAWKHGPRVCLGLFEAATAHGVPLVQGAPAHMYLESVSDAALKAFGLARAARAERGTVSVVEPRFPESTFRACVLALRRDGSRVPVVDVLQTWLEIADHPARGRELADEVERRVIDPWLLEDDERAATR